MYNEEQTAAKLQGGKMRRNWKWQSLSRVWHFVTPWTIQYMDFSRPEYWSGLLFPSPGDLPNPGIKPRSSALQVDSLPAEPPGKPKNTGVGSLSLLQGIFPTQESNLGLLNYRWILYQLSYQGRLFTADGDCSLEIKRHLLLGRKLWPT